jgi:hypothetical protein
MNTGPGGCGNPARVFAAAHGPGLCCGAGPAIIGNRNNGHRRTPPPWPGRPGPPGGTFPTGPPNHPIRRRSGTERRGGGKKPEKLLAPDGMRTPNRVGACPGRLEEGRGMDSVTRGSGIALSVLVAATASILLLVPGKPAGSWRGPGTSGRVVMASAAATSSWGPSGPGSPPSASGSAGRQPAAGRRPGCWATGARSGRAQAGVTSLRPRRVPWRAARPGSCRAPRAHRHRHTSRRLSRYREIRPDLP